MGPILNTIIGAGIKVACTLINSWLEQKRQDQMLLSARDNEMFKLMMEQHSKQSSDHFVKVSRRILFMGITFTMCYLMIFYAHNPDISYQIVVPKGEGYRSGFFNWFIGSKEWEIVELTGGLMLSSFMDLCFMVIGFYAMPSKK
jgi:hypothetical protein|tara:strand:+ start:752 stop:1183 length:432 start_codon:yes stop_codon:yes gene_type:complete